MFLRDKMQEGVHLLDSGPHQLPLSQPFINSANPDVLLSASVPASTSDSRVIKPREAFRAKSDILPFSTVKSLVTQMQGKHVFSGVGAVSPNGTPFLLMNATTMAGFRTCKQNAPLAAWWWCGDTPFGRVFRFSTGPDRPVAEAFLPMPCAVYKSFLQTGRIAFATSHAKQVSDTYIADFTDDPLWLAARQPNATNSLYSDFLFTDPDLAYWWLMALPGMEWSERINARPQDSLHTDWALAAARRTRDFHDWYSEVRRQLTGKSMPGTYADHNLASEHPYFFQLLQAVYAGASVGTLVELAGQSLQSADAAHDMVRACVVAWQWHTDVAARVAIGALRLSWHVHPATHAGRRRPWFNRRGRLIAPDFIILDPAELGHGARNYWRDVDLQWPIDHGCFINGTDLPADTASFRHALSALTLAATFPADPMPLAQAILREAREHKQWSLPPTGARIELGLASFPLVDLYEMGSRYWCVLRNPHNRYVLVMVDLNDGTIDIPDMSQGDDSPDQEAHAKGALSVVLVSVIRDLLVTDQRELIFTARPNRAKTQRTQGATSKAPSHVFLPRRSFERITGFDAANADFGAFKPRAKHWVSGHLRNCANPSAEQRLLAQVEGILLPAGKTYVRAHSRGDAEREQVRRNHRAKSACDVLYPAVEGAASNAAEWFNFERQAHLFAAARKLTVGSTPPLRVDAMDMLAVHRQREELWLIRFVRLPARQYVGAKVVQNLLDTITQHQIGTKAMIVSTSGFTPEAVAVATKHAVTLIDGPQFSASAESSGAPG